MECNVCNGTFISWDSRMLQQLTVDVRSHFPALLTRNYGCDMAVVGLLRVRTLGNSPTALCHNLHEVHSEEWMRKQLSYLGDCERHRYNVQCADDVTFVTNHREDVSNFILLPQGMKKQLLSQISLDQSGFWQCTYVMCGHDFLSSKQL